MRYSVISKVLTIPQMRDYVQRYGGRNIRTAPLMKQVFCDLDAEGYLKLKSVNGLVVKMLERVSTDQGAIPAVEVPTIVPPEEVYYTATQLLEACRFFDLRALFSPPLTGAGSTVVIVDSGIRKTHESLVGKVVYEKNFSTSSTPDDVFCHGTGVAYMVAGGVHGYDAGVAPGAALWNIKVLGDTGECSEEAVVLALEHVMEKRGEALNQGLSMHDPMMPSIINMSLGSLDTGDPDSPMRVACQECLKLGMGILAAAGNNGPAPGTITSPACDPMVVAVGALTVAPFTVWANSSRGPTKEGLTKPDFGCYGVNVMVAGAGSDTEYLIKSGTSFSTPVIGGLAALAIELPTRLGEEFMPEPNCVQMVVDSCVKPLGIALEQDNMYGWGMPWGEDLVQYFQPPVTPIEEVLAPITEIIAPILLLGLLGMMVPAMIKV